MCKNTNLDYDSGLVTGYIKSNPILCSSFLFRNTICIIIVETWYIILLFLQFEVSDFKQIYVLKQFNKLKESLKR